MDGITTLEIVCPAVEEMAGEWNKAETEDEMREIIERDPETDYEWIEWILAHNDIDNYFTQKIVNIVCMPEFRQGTFVLNGDEFTIIKS